MALFSLSLNFFTFTRRSRKIKMFFVKKNQGWAFLRIPDWIPKLSTFLDTRIRNPWIFKGNYKQKKILGYQIKYLQNIRILNLDQIRFLDTRLKIRIPKFWKLVRIPVSAHPWGKQKKRHFLSNSLNLCLAVG